jgi:hypothetical protein
MTRAEAIAARRDSVSGIYLRWFYDLHALSHTRDGERSA